MKFGKYNLFSIFLIIVAFVIVVSISGLIFRTLKQSSIYEGFSSSGPQYYDPSMPSPSVNQNTTPYGFFPTGAYGSNWSGGSNDTCTTNNVDFAVVFQNTKTGYYSYPPFVLGNARNDPYCNPTVYVALNNPLPANTQLVLLNSYAGANSWNIVNVPVTDAKGEQGSISGAYRFGGKTGLIGVHLILSLLLHLEFRRFLLSDRAILIGRVG